MARRVIVVEHVPRAPSHMYTIPVLESLSTWRFRRHPHNLRTDEGWQALWKELGWTLVHEHDADNLFFHHKTGTGCVTLHTSGSVGDLRAGHTVALPGRRPRRDSDDSRVRFHRPCTTGGHRRRHHGIKRHMMIFIQKDASGYREDF